MNQEHMYGSLAPDQMEELFSNYLFDSWSYSKVSSFARNEKAFEMYYIYGERSKMSSTSIAGSAYHKALETFFNKYKENKEVIDVASMEVIAFDYIEEVEANKWKIQKTTPSVDKCKEKALKVATSLIHNFYGEMSLYIDEIKEILEVEFYTQQFVTINGVDIPLPCAMVIDLVFINHDDEVIVVDHKSKNAYSDDKEVALVIGRQAITYVIGYETQSGRTVSQVWFVENKYSQNRDKSKQLNCFKVRIDKDTRRLYEALLYEPLVRMLGAISDPDYVYLINENDHFVDKAELYEFWAKTQIAEIEDFNIPHSKRQLIEKRLKKIRDASIATITPSVIKSFKQNASEFIQYNLSNKDMSQSDKIEHIMRSYGIPVQVAHEFNGYSSNTFLVDVPAGAKIQSIHSRKMDIANALDVPNIRIMRDLLVYEKKSYLAIEAAKERERFNYFDASYLDGMKIPLGKDNFERLVVWDLNNQSTPHALIGGATGSGKSVEVKCIIEYARLAGISQIDILDPKCEFSEYEGVPGFRVAQDIEEIEKMAHDHVTQMNELVKGQSKKMRLLVFDEIGDAFMMARKGNALNIYETVTVGKYANGNPKLKRECVGRMKSLEENHKILLQKGRSTGLRILSATQRTSTDVISGSAKVNTPVQICFRVPKEVDSRVIIDEAGGEALAGYGDGLIKSPEYLDTVRFQGFWNPEWQK